MITENTKLTQLKKNLEDMGQVLVAFSGGVDSTFILKIAHETLAGNATALTAISPSLPASEKEFALNFARSLSVRHFLVETKELENPDYVKNPVNRCYFCKTELYRACSEQAQTHGIPWIIDGFNQDDQKDYRPGFQAKEEFGVRSPLLEVGLTKEEIRALSRAWGLPTSDKPASPCLASRIPYGTAIHKDLLGKIERLEDFLKQKGLKEFRVRYHEKTVRLETSPKDFFCMCEEELRCAWIRLCKKEGFEFVTLDLEGFRSGRLNEAAGIKV